MSSCKLWRKFTFGAKEWTFFECDPEVCKHVGYFEDDDSWVQAMTLSYLAQVHFDGTVPRSKRQGTVLHECVHIACSEHNEELTAALFGCLPGDARATEERVAAFCAGPLAGVLTALGTLKKRT
jgi:hypothetical protein